MESHRGQQLTQAQKEPGQDGQGPARLRSGGRGWVPEIIGHLWGTTDVSRFSIFGPGVEPREILAGGESLRATRLLAGEVLVRLMSAFKGIVIAMDGDDQHSWTAFERGIVLASLMKLEARLLYMLQGGEVAALDLEKRARARAAELAVRLAIELEVGKNKDILLEEAANRSWILVMGTPGASTTAERIFGSLVDQVIRRTRGAVLVEVHSDTVQPKPWDTAMVQGNRKPRLLVGLDGSVQSALALTQTFRLARAMDAEVFGVYVQRPDKENEDLEDEAEMLLEMSMEMGVTATFQTIEADTVHGGLAGLMDRGFDMMVISSHGRGKLKERLLGSHARDIIMAARYPVILVRPGRS